MERPASVQEALDKIEACRKAKHNLILLCDPDNLPPGHALIVETVKFDASQDGGDIYYHSLSKKWMIHNQGLMKLALAANVQWVASETKAVKCSRDYVHFTAVGMVLKEYGRQIAFRGDYELDLEAEKEDLFEAYTAKMKAWNKKAKKEGKPLRTEEWVSQQVDRDYRFRRQHKLKLAASGAKAVVIRKLLALKSGYSKQEINRPFTVVRTFIPINFEDPKVQDKLIEATAAAMLGIYGGATGPTALPGAPPAADDVIDIPPANIAPPTPDESVNTPTADTPEAAPDRQPGDEEEQSTAAIPETLEQFEALDQKRQVEILEVLAANKGYNLATLPTPLENFNQRNRSRFYTHLVSLPDPEDDIPF